VQNKLTETLGTSASGVWIAFVSGSAGADRAEAAGDAVGVGSAGEAGAKIRRRSLAVERCSTGHAATGEAVAREAVAVREGADRGLRESVEDAVARTAATQNAAVCKSIKSELDDIS
jgi:hypothetical protein